MNKKYGSRRLHYAGLARGSASTYQYQHSQNAEELRKTHLQMIQLLDPKPSEKVLDLGCGRGRNSLALLQRGVFYIGCDISPHAIADAKGKIAANSLTSSWRLAVADAHSLPFKDNSLDKMFCAGSFSYFDQQSQAIREVHQVLKKEGVFVVNIVNILDYVYFESVFKSRLFVFLKPLIDFGIAHSRFLELCSNLVLKRDIRKLDAEWLCPQLGFRVKRFVMGNGFHVTDFYIVSGHVGEGEYLPERHLFFRGYSAKV